MLLVIDHSFFLLKAPEDNRDAAEMSQHCYSVLIY